MKINYKQICKDFNEFVNLQRKDWGSNVLQVELTGFMPEHRVGGGRNSVSTLLELKSVFTEANAIEVVKSDTRNSNYLTVYISSRVAASHSFGREKATLLTFRDKKGKRRTVECQHSLRESDFSVGSFESLFGSEIGADVDPNGYVDWLNEQNENVLKLVADTDRDSEIDLTWARQSKRKNYTKEYYKRVLGAIGIDYFDKIKELCEYTGVKFVSSFKFVDKYNFSPDFVNVGSGFIEFGFHSVGTYNRLPMVLKVTKVKEIKVVKLSELGIEGSGYYSHDDKMCVRPEQVSEANRFNNRFKTTKERSVARVLKSVKAA